MDSNLGNGLVEQRIHTESESSEKITCCIHSASTMTTFYVELPTNICRPSLLQLTQVRTDARKEACEKVLNTPDRILVGESAEWDAW